MHRSRISRIFGRRLAFSRRLIFDGEHSSSLATASTVRFFSARMARRRKPSWRWRTVGPTATAIPPLALSDSPRLVPMACARYITNQKFSCQRSGNTRIISTDSSPATRQDLRLPHGVSPSSVALATVNWQQGTAIAVRHPGYQGKGITAGEAAYRLSLVHRHLANRLVTDSRVNPSGDTHCCDSGTCQITLTEKLSTQAPRRQGSLLAEWQKTHICSSWRLFRTPSVMLSPDFTAAGRIVCLRFVT